jgi:hypothetical protein
MASVPALSQAFPLHMTADVLKTMLHLGRQLLKQYGASPAHDDAKRLAVCV